MFSTQKATTGLYNNHGLAGSSLRLSSGNKRINFYACDSNAGLGPSPRSLISLPSPRPPWSSPLADIGGFSRIFADIRGKSPEPWSLKPRHCKAKALLTRVVCDTLMLRLPCCDAHATMPMLRCPCDDAHCDDAHAAMHMLQGAPFVNIGGYSR